MINGQQVTDSIHGIAGIGTTQLIDQIQTDGNMDIVKLVIQVAIGLMTLFNLWNNRNKKS